MSLSSKYIIALLSFSISINAFSGAVIDGKKVSTVNAGGGDNCTLFKLEGINGAMPSTPNDPWFAIPTSDPTHDVVVSILLTAYSSGKPVRINVNENLTCGKAGINYIRFSEQ